MLNVFLLLTAYYTIKPVREALILGSAGAEIKAYTGAIQALVFMAIVPFYSAFANRVNRLDSELEGFGSELIALMVREGRI